MKALVCANKYKIHNYYEKLLTIEPSLAQFSPGHLKSKIIPSLKHIIIIDTLQRSGVFIFDEILQNVSIKEVESIKHIQHEISPSDVFNIQFTSGSTGNPKGVTLTHFNLVNSAFYVGKRNELELKYHRICTQVPFFHAFGTVCSIIAGLHFGATLVLPTDGYNPDRSLEAIENERCTIIYGTPTMFIDLIQKQSEKNRDLSFVEIAACGAASCAPDLFKEMLSKLKVKRVKVMYGLTESSSVIFQSLLDESVKLATSSVGHLSEHVQVKVVDKNEEIVPFGLQGELYVKGYCVMKGYWKDEEKTKETMTSDGWLKTGDQFVLWENGYGNIVGRSKELIVRGGENISPKEIEDCLYTHCKILEVYVIGWPHERLGEEVCACIKLKPGQKMNIEDIRSFCIEKLSCYKIPTKVYFLNHFPKTSSGKIQKHKLTKMITS